MSKKLSGSLFGLSRSIGKAASMLNTLETIATGNPEKIAKHASRKAVNALAYGAARKASKLIK